ncbi:TPA: hypothetical protein STX52_003840 [Clostridioides difficile]|nr:hypothetical protein QEW_0686 [Clostridioides difficile CD160]MCC0642602.1 hypothetical protein [Clostridioides sp. ES-S-0049-03]MCC0662490.1 hypothetical protein [Clostridioides sp. ZZV15-6597]MCC0678526.1 hypothetical protein [Clostridioides sp. ES-W-0018-02]MCC0682482.1 hypothetical protein [Clostridioides sp. ES-S-0005-03]MCC0705213.1 hypothetical protein [Clostridioides sp. ES-S-0049-02]MCC0707210.1 hypothetical protein [Clostridioides sp. ES-S-0190-01]MCC0713337.1 hypothetical prote
MVNLMMNVIAGLIACWIYDRLKNHSKSAAKSGWELNIKFQKNKSSK